MGLISKRNDTVNNNDVDDKSTRLRGHFNNSVKLMLTTEKENETRNIQLYTLQV